MWWLRAPRNSAYSSKAKSRAGPKSSKMQISKPISFFLFSIVLALPVSAQNWPVKPLRLIVAFPPGGTNDIVARSVAQRMSERLRPAPGNENRPGANGALGAEAAAKSPADGYTLFVAAVNHVVLPALYPKLPYDIERD